MSRETGIRYEMTGGALLLGAVLLLLIALLTNRQDITSATLILSGAGCFVSALYILTYSRRDQVDHYIAALLPTQGQIEICSLCADLGLHGRGYVLPPTEHRAITHFIPVAEYHPPHLEPEAVFAIESEGSCGVALTPSGVPLLTLLEQEHGLTIPTDEAGLLTAIEEVLVSSLDMGDEVTVARAGETIIVTLIAYRLIEGCRVVQSRSPACCTTYSCPICSLIACLLARGTGKVVTLERAEIEGQDLRLIYAFPLQ